LLQLFVLLHTYNMYAMPFSRRQVVTNVIKLCQAEPNCMSAAYNRAFIMSEHEAENDSFSMPKV